MTLIFDLLFRDFFSLGESFRFHSLLCDFSSMLYSLIHDSPPVMTLSKNSSFPLRFSSQRNTLSVATFAQE